MQRIELTRGEFALVDDEDYPELSKINWCLLTGGKRGKYARSARYGLMHHMLLAPPVDHIDGDGLNNQRSNLRRASVSQNQANQRKLKPGTSSYKGVSWYPRYGKWRARVTCEGLTTSLGYFDSELDAAIAYDDAARELFGEYARTNFEQIFND